MIIFSDSRDPNRAIPAEQTTEVVQNFKIVWISDQINRKNKFAVGKLLRWTCHWRWFAHTFSGVCFR